MRNSNEITINGKQLSKILELHRKWIYDEIGGERANLRDANLSDANLSDVIKNKYTIGLEVSVDINVAIRNLLPALNRLILTDEENEAIKQIAEIVKYPTKK